MAVSYVEPKFLTRQIYEVFARKISSSGTYSSLSGYPKLFDGVSYNSSAKAKNAALSDYYKVLGNMYADDSNQWQSVGINLINDGSVIVQTSFGEIENFLVTDVVEEPEIG